MNICLWIHHDGMSKTNKTAHHYVLHLILIPHGAPSFTKQMYFHSNVSMHTPVVYNLAV